MTTRARVPWSVRREQVGALLDRCSRERCSLREGALRAGLRVAAVYGWRRRLVAERCGSAGDVAPAVRGGAFVELVAESAARSAVIASTAAAVEVQLPGGATIRVGHDFDAALLRRVVAALQA
jgi:hypothetical protein